MDGAVLLHITAIFNNDPAPVSPESGPGANVNIFTNDNIACHSGLWVYECRFMNNGYKRFKLVDHGGKLQQTNYTVQAVWHSFTSLFSMEKQQKKPVRPLQKQPKPGRETKLKPHADTTPKGYDEGKLKDKVAVITGADSGIGKATALLFAKEGADIVVSYLSETEDANDTKRQVNEYGRTCLLVKGDIGKEANCKKLIDKTMNMFGKIDILVNNAGMHWESESIEDISTAQLMKTFHSNFYSCFWLTKYAVPYLKKGSSIINTTSVTAYRGSPKLIDYAATKGAIVAFTRSLCNSLIKKGIRVNAVAPGPVWTPLIASTFSKKKVAEFGSDSPMQRAGEPNEIATCFLFLASEDASFISGQVLHPNGGEIING